MNVGSLFSGIGGFDLGFERAGMRTVWFCEQDPFCQRVLAKHWPGVPCHPDVRALVADTPLNGRGPRREGRPDSDGAGQQQSPLQGGLPVPVPHIDVLCGGFPCQDISLAGRGAGIDGSRSGLWAEFARLIGELRPRYVVVENVPAITSRGLDRVLGDLAACGFDAEWDHLPASAFGAPHRRDRFWLVAYPEREGLEGFGSLPGIEEVAEPRNDGALADSNGRRLPLDSQQDGSGPLGQGKRSQWNDLDGLRGADWWSVEPAVGRVAHGVPARVDRLRSLGNSLVPQIAEWIGRQLMAYENEQRAA